VSIKIRRAGSGFFNLHTHSRYSANDALPQVKDLAAKAAALGQPALGLTDHGNMAGSVELYTSCRKAGILPFPGTELYMVYDREDKKAKRFHMGVVAYTSEGYRNLVGLNTMANLNFHHKPLIGMADLALLHGQGLLKGIAALSGCHFSITSQTIVAGEDPDQHLSTLAAWFDRFYVELQNHNIEQEGTTDDRIADTLWEAAERLGLPCVVTQDSHYTDLDDRSDHETLKRLVAFGPDADDAVFPGDGFHLADDQWMADHHPVARLEAGLAGLRDLVSAHELRIPELDSYSYNIPFTVADPQSELVSRVWKAMEDRGIAYPGHRDRLLDELEIIRDTGMAGYLILVAEVVAWCKEKGIFYQARGSASGSLVCWLLDITQVDPIRWKLRFERFISRDRMKPPDVDLDIEYEHRKDLIDWLSDRFSVHQIGIWLKHSLAGDDSGVGSLRVKYYARAKASGVAVGDWSEVPDSDKSRLHALSQRQLFSGYGVHAAGMVVTTNDAVFNNLVPMMKVASSKTMVTQYAMGDIEALGLVKLDILGLRTLSVLSKAMRNLGRDVKDGMDWIPLNDAKTFKMISEGKTDGVFQLEGGSARRGCRELKPTHIRDVIAAMALFRPATMNSGATESYIRRKHREEQAGYLHEVIANATKDTYGILLYQEQVITILRDLGMSPEELTSLLKAVKASNADIGSAGVVIASHREEVQALAKEAGMSEPNFEWLWDMIEGFAEYGFNRAHATAYGITAYRCAYLKAHHPVEFFAALLEVAAGTDKEEAYVRAARQSQIRIRKASALISKASYTVDTVPNSIRRGLLSIDNVGKTAAEAIVQARPEEGWSTLIEMCEAVDKRKVTGAKPYLEMLDPTVGTIGALLKAGALEGLEVENEHLAVEI
jgi:DNA polymerase III subunit alpha